MPKAKQYTKGSIIYFSGDIDDRIFILQKGQVLLTYTNIETGQPVSEPLHNGEFFGVKSSLGHFPREETATVITDTIAIILSISEFENIFSNNKELIMKMLRVFSNQLRTIHKQTESILHNNETVSNQEGMMEVAHSFFADEQYRACSDVCQKLIDQFPASPKVSDAQKLLEDSNRRYKNQIKSNQVPVDSCSLKDGEENNLTLKQFSLPTFTRFAKSFEPGQVIISEFEPGANFYLIQAGQVQLVKCVNGTKKNLDILMPGEFFGEMAILDESPRSATCVAIDEVEVLEFNKENFAILVTGNPQIAIILLKLFCKRIYDQKRRFKILCIKDTQARICDVFLMFDEMQHSNKNNERQRRFNLTIQDLSHWAGLPVDAVHEEINKLVEKRRLEIFDNYMVVTNIGEIKRMVEQKSQQRL
jgi:CRP-like cAMP-binding protein